MQMDQLEQLINPNALSIVELKEMGCTPAQIEQYTQKRSYIWNTACRIFNETFAHLGLFYVLKEFDSHNLCMRVRIYRRCDNLTRAIAAEGYHRDPVYALVECAKMLNNEEDFLSALMAGLSV
jgi:hypothetical protein